jgi:acyl transferase domain-containing protein
MIAGHSAGESSALFAAGAIPTDTPFSVLQTIADIGRHDGADSSMLAVGTGKGRVEKLLSAEGLLGDEAQLYIAMDNCPHQVILVGMAAAIERAAKVLKQANIILQRLTIPRPYHTPLFHPYMAALTELGLQVQLQTPQIPLYSCSTAKRFSDDPEQIRQLAIDHWEQPVEFTRLIEQMYEDGARIFVEVGPRGNLTSFAEDTLRGRPVVTVTANRMGRSATLQIAHLVGELWVQGVPLNLNAFNTVPTSVVPEPGYQGVA